mgnify:CR=1 FL=1
MSQTESLLLVALGFALALVLAMIFGFAIWSSANRWASYKRKREVPTTILDMQAEREALRAQNAMSTRRLQFQLDETRAQWAEKSAQLTRLRNRAIVMAKDLIAKDAEIASLRALAAELTNETNRRAKIIARLTGHEAVKLRSFDMPVPEGTKPAVIGEAKSDGTTEPSAPIDRIKAKIAELNALSAQIAGEQDTHKRQGLILRFEIQHYDYLAVVNNRMTQMSVALRGHNPDAEITRAKAEAHTRAAAERRELYTQHFSEQGRSQQHSASAGRSTAGESRDEARADPDRDKLKSWGGNYSAAQHSATKYSASKSREGKEAGSEPGAFEQGRP